METVPMDELSAKYIELRKKRELLKADFSSVDKVLEKEMDDIENKLVDALNSMNLDSMSTSNATIVRRISRHYSTTNWDDFYKIMAEYGAFGLLTQRIHSANMKQFLDEHPDIYPEGLNVDSRYAVTVRRKTPTPE
jgi:hypothetical protein